MDPVLLTSTPLNTTPPRTPTPPATPRSPATAAPPPPQTSRAVRLSGVCGQ